MTAKEFLQMLPKFINKKATKNAQVTFAFWFTGDEPGEYTLEIDRGTCRFQEGIPEKPSVTIECPSQVWVAIANRSMTPAQARKSGQFKVRGKFWLMYWFNKYFSGDPDFCEVEDGLHVWTENEIELREGHWTIPRRVLGIQASPRKRKGATEWLYANLIEGMSEAGAEVNTMYLADKEFSFCRGCFTCWTKTQGKCINKDDLTDLIPTIPSYDLLILAAPLYVDGMPGMLKSFIDRLIILGHPAIISKESHCRHPSRFTRMPNLVFVSVCGFIELENFDPLIEHVKAISRNTHMPLIASILRPAASLIIASDKMKGARARIDAAVKAAGKEIIEQGRVSNNLTKEITQPLLTRGQFLAGAKGWWENY